MEGLNANSSLAEENSNPQEEEGLFMVKASYVSTQTFLASSKSSKQRLGIKILSPRAIIPPRAYPKSIGYDLYSSRKCEIPPGGNILVPIGVTMTPPKGCYIRIAPRSGLALKHQLQVGAGVIDPDYTEEIGVVLFNHSNRSFPIGIGDKIAQAIVEQAKVPKIELLKYLKPSK